MIKIDQHLELDPELDNNPISTRLVPGSISNGHVRLTSFFNWKKTNILVLNSSDANY